MGIQPVKGRWYGGLFYMQMGTWIDTLYSISLWLRGVFILSPNVRRIFNLLATLYLPAGGKYGILKCTPIFLYSGSFFPFAGMIAPCF